MKPYYPVDMQYKIFQRFGEHPEIYPKRHGHPGIDFATPMRSNLYAVCDGTITAAAYREAGGYGREVFIKAGKYTIIYGHLSGIDVRVGDHVTRGQIIGASGGDPNDNDKLDGFSSGPHLHFEVRDLTQPQQYPLIGAVDPEKWLDMELDSPTAQNVNPTQSGQNIPSNTVSPVLSRPVASGGKVRVVSDWATVRLTPNGQIIGKIYQGNLLPTCGEVVNDDYPWQPVTVYVSWKSQSGSPLLEEVKE